MLHTKNQSISFVVFDKIFNVFTLIPPPPPPPFDLDMQELEPFEQLLKRAI